MANLPKVVILFSNGNLLQDVAAVDGIAGIVGTAAAGALIGVPTQVFSLQDAIDKGFTLADYPEMYRHLSEFYAEVGGNQELWVMVVVNTTTMTDMLTETNASGAKKLTAAAGGKIRLLGIVRTPDNAYDPGTDFLDSDVSDAVTATSTFGDARLAELNPLRILVEGRVVAENSATIYQPSGAAANYAGVVLGGSLNDGSASVGTALGRAVKYGAQIKLGKVANGPLALTSCYIGTKKITELTNLDALHGKGYISFMTQPQKAGFYFGIDRMANTGDYRLLAYGRVIDKAAIIAAAVYVEQLESEIDLDAAGKISALDAKHLTDLIDAQVNSLMGDQVSSFSSYIDPTQVIVNTGKLNLKLSITPKGYTSEIDIDLGMASPA